MMTGARRFSARMEASAVIVVLVIVGGVSATASHGWRNAEFGVVQAFQTAHSPFGDAVALAINLVFSPPFAVAWVVVISLVVLVASRRPSVALRFAAVVTLPWLGSEIIKHIVNRPRPDHALLAHPLITETSNSFPSGHTAFAASLGMGLIMLAMGRSWRPLVIGLVAVSAVLVAVSRVYLGVHYPTDVAASLVYAPVSIAAVAALWDRFLEPRLARAA